MIFSSNTLRDTITSKARREQRITSATLGDKLRAHLVREPDQAPTDKLHDLLAPFMFKDDKWQDSDGFMKGMRFIGVCSTYYFVCFFLTGPSVVLFENGVQLYQR